MKRRKKPDPNQSGFGDILLAEMAKRLGEDYKIEKVTTVTYEEARNLNGLFEARWETPGGWLCATFDITKDAEMLRPGDALELRAILNVNRRPTGNVHICDAL